MVCSNDNAGQHGLIEKRHLLMMKCRPLRMNSQLLSILNRGVKGRGHVERIS